jgi:hypothetical protein
MRGFLELGGTRINACETLPAIAERDDLTVKCTHGKPRVTAICHAHSSAKTNLSSYRRDKMVDWFYRYPVGKGQTVIVPVK